MARAKKPKHPLDGKDHISDGRTLPAWATAVPDKPMVIAVDPDIAYPAILAELGDLLGEEQAPNRFNVEVAYQFVKLDLQSAMGTFGFTIHIVAHDGRKDRWALANLPNSLGVMTVFHALRDPDVYRATKGREARALYIRLRGGLPKGE